MTVNTKKMDKTTGERRIVPRAGISFPVECSLLPKTNYFYTVSKDLSTGGAKIITDHINLINKIVDVKAKVAWCNKERIADRYSAGVKFVELTKPNQNAIINLLQKITNH